VGVLDRNVIGVDEKEEGEEELMAFVEERGS
jgi:hypothetical protein